MRRVGPGPRSGSILATVLLALCVARPLAAQPRALRSAAEILAALKDGGQVRVVMHFHEMKLVNQKGEEEKSPDTFSGMTLEPYEYFAAGSIGNPVGYLASSHAQLIRHARYGYIYDYLKVSVYDNDQVKILVQYLSPTTFELKMEETFTTTVADGKNAGRAAFFRAQ
jgi:hypothetical protein